MRKKYLISILTLSALMISTLVWDSIKLPFDYQNSMYGEYEKQNYNPNNDTLRFIFFVLIPLMTFFVCYLKFNKENLFTVNQVLNAKVLNQTKIDSSKLFNLFFYLVIFLIIIDFLLLSYNKHFYNLDFFHEGAYLTASKNLQFKDGLWTSTYLEYGLYGNLFPAIFWKVFGLENIGSIRFFLTLLSLFNKILLVIISKKISENFFFNEKSKINYFIFLSIFAISLVSYEYWRSYIPPKLFLIFVFLLIFFDSFKKKSNFFNTNILLGLFSSVSIFWYIDIGAYLNALLFFLLAYLVFRKEYKNFFYTLLGIVISWLFLFIFLPNNEIFAFYENTITVFKSADYLDGLIYPTPFFSKDIRSTRTLLLIIITGIFVIIFNFDKKIKANIEAKIFFSFLFLLNIFIFKSALVRSDTPHIKSSSGLLIFLLISIFLYFAIKKLAHLLNKNHPIFEKYYLIFPLVILFSNFFLFSSNLVNLKNTPFAFADAKKLITQNDSNYLSKDYLEMLKYYKSLTENEKCVQIFTNETAIPYLLNKPTCTKYYSMWVSAPKKNQNFFIEELKFSKPKFILFDSKLDIYDDTHERLPLVLNFINENYSFHSKFKSWTFVKYNFDY